jgi:hypothetical protein
MSLILYRRRSDEKKCLCVISWRYITLHITSFTLIMNTDTELISYVTFDKLNECYTENDRHVVVVDPATIIKSFTVVC